MRIAAIAAAVVIGLGMTGCDLEDSGNAPIKSAHKNKDTGSDDQAAPAVDNTPAPDPGVRPTVDTIGLKVIVKSKTCYGSAGCNIEYNVAVGWSGVGKPHFNDDYDVKYAVTGDESGPQIDTVVLHPNGKYDVPYEGIASTPSSYTKLGIKILHISKHYGF